MNQGRYKEALEKFQIVLKIYMKNRGEKSWHVAVARLHMGVTFSRADSQGEAISLYEKVLASKGVHRHEITAIAQYDMGVALLSDRPNEAKEYFERAIETYQRIGLGGSKYSRGLESIFGPTGRI